MTTQTIETPAEPVQADPEQSQVETQTETPAEPAESVAAEPDPAAAALQVQTEEAKPDYMTRADWEREKVEVASRAAADALESDRRRRQTENARRATQEKRDAESKLEARDVVKAAFGAAGIYEVPDEAVYSAIERVARKQAESLTTNSLDVVDSAFDFIAAPAYGQTAELDEASEPAARRLAPKIQHLIDTLRPQIEAKAREGYIAEADLSKRVDAEIARRNAKGREGQEELKRIEGTPSPADTSTVSEHLDRIGTPRETPADRAWWEAREKARGR